MFDNLREQADSSPFDSTPFYEDEAQFEQAQPKPTPVASRRRRAAPANGRLLGMTPAQRFILACMLLVTVCILGSMMLVAFGKISLF